MKTDKVLDLSAFIKNLTGFKRDYLPKNNELEISKINKISNGYALLHNAVKEVDIEIVKYLLEAGANVNIRTSLPKELGHADRTALGIVLDKIAEVKQATNDLNEEGIKNLEEIKELLIDYGADFGDIGKYKKALEEKESDNGRRQQRKKDLETKVSLTIEKERKEKSNLRIVEDCAEDYPELEKIYKDFYRFLQSRFTDFITALKSEATGLLTIKPPISTTPITNVINKTLSSIPGIGGVLGVSVSNNYSSFASKQQLEEFKHKASHFINNSHIDEVSQDYCARMVQYYKEEILIEDMDGKSKSVEESKGKLEALSIKVLSAISGVSRKELLEKYNKHGQQILAAHWEELAARCILQFLDYLIDNNVSYDVDLGIRAAESLLPNWSKELLIDTKAVGFSMQNARALGEVANLCYQSKTKISEIGKQWGFKGEECYVRQTDFFKSVVMYDKDKIIISFRGTYHNINWLSNANMLEQSIEVNGKQLAVHRGFLKALMKHWDEVGDNGEKPLKEIIKNYLQTHKEAKIFITGHSLGAAMASLGYCKLLNMEIEGQGVSIDRITLYNYGQPLWCKARSLLEANTLFNNNYFRIVNYQDLVPTVPSESMGYKHLGKLIYIYIKTVEY